MKHIKLFEEIESGEWYDQFGEDREPDKYEWIKKKFVPTENQIEGARRAVERLIYKREHFDEEFTDLLENCEIVARELGGSFGIEEPHGPGVFAVCIIDIGENLENGYKYRSLPMNRLYTRINEYHTMRTIKDYSYFQNDGGKVMIWVGTK